MTVAMAIAVSLIASLVAAELFGGIGLVSELLVGRAAGRLPRHHRERYRHEWLAELDSIRDRGPLTKLGWAVGLYLRSRATGAVLAVTPFRPAPHDLFWGEPSEGINQLAYEEALRQLASGNRETEESHEDSEWRSQMAQWVEFPEELIGKHGDFELLLGAGIKLAPLTFDALVKIWKRALLRSND